jgi:hypothetical protein
MVGKAGHERLAKPNGRKLMPKGPRGDKRPPDVSGAAVPVSRIAAGDAEGKAGNGGEAGGATRAKSVTSPRRKEIDKAASSPRWEG